ELQQGSATLVCLASGGSPLTVEAELEGGGRQQHHIGLTQPGAPGE
ncbi:hypothetical protein D4764_0016500, partial [Takifugu flavidus]